MKYYQGIPTVNHAVGLLICADKLTHRKRKILKGRSSNKVAPNHFELNLLSLKSGQNRDLESCTKFSTHYTITSSKKSSKIMLFWFIEYHNFCLFYRSRRSLWLMSLGHILNTFKSHRCIKKSKFSIRVLRPTWLTPKKNSIFGLKI